jgi:hypothetical protein
LGLGSHIEDQVEIAPTEPELAAHFMNHHHEGPPWIVSLGGRRSMLEQREIGHVHEEIDPLLLLTGQIILRRYEWKCESKGLH